MIEVLRLGADAPFLRQVVARTATPFKGVENRMNATMPTRIPHCYWRRRATLALILIASCEDVQSAETSVSVFNGVGIQFGGDANWNSQAGAIRQDNGRVVERTLQLPALGEMSKVTANLNIWAGSDPWDRAGAIQLVNSAGTVELHKFVTGFGGTTSHQADLTNLIPYLRNGPVAIRAFIDTWVPQAWKLDFNLIVDDAAEHTAPSWNRLVFNDQEWRAGEFPNNRRAQVVTIPPGLEDIYLSYLASGHAIDGSGGDEFIQRTHHIFIDGVEVFDVVPWRTDGINFRRVNPTSGRFGDTWSSDFPRSGWVPGDDVDPYVIDVSQYLSPGRHTIEYQIDGIRPADANGYGYWRTSSYLTGFAQPVDADFDGDGVVDGADLLQWQRGLGSAGLNLQEFGDANGDGFVNDADLISWRKQFGESLDAADFADAAIPEPTSALLVINCVVAYIRIRRRGRRVHCRERESGGADYYYISALAPLT